MVKDDLEHLVAWSLREAATFVVRRLSQEFPWRKDPAALS
jgi:hypothetical protein